ncbi:unnamed protein product [Closterium sp. Naga37s-1]|nr:unnamed protein product [Closterium sp. Naga37s-1]
MKHASVTNAYAAIAVMKLTQVLSQAHATAGYNRNKFLVFALLSPSPGFRDSGYDDAATWICAAAAAGKGAEGKAHGGGRGGALGTGQGGTSALRLSNATGPLFQARVRHAGECVEAGDGARKGGRREGGQLGWGRLKSRGQGKTPALRLSNATDRTLKRGLACRRGFVYFQRIPPLCKSLCGDGLSPLPSAPATSMLGPFYSIPACFLPPLPLPFPIYQRSHSIDPFSLHTLSLPPSSPFLPQADPSPPYPSNITYYSSPIYGQFTLRVLEWVVYHQQGHGHCVDLLSLPSFCPAPTQPPTPATSPTPSAPYASNITYCSSPIYGQFNSLRVLEWVVYHQQGHGVDLFHMYNAGGMGEPIMRTLGPFIKEGQMTVTDVTEVDEFETWFGQVRGSGGRQEGVLVVNDCAYRSLFTSRWQLSHPNPRGTLPGL